MNKIFPSAVFALLAAGAAQGAEPDHLNVQEPARPAYLERKPQGDFSLPPLMQEEAAPAPGATGIVLEAVRFVGNTAIATADLQAVARPYLGRPLGIADLEILRRKVTLLYVERGYVNSGAVLATDALEDATLTLRIVEGSLREIRLRGLDGLDERYVADRLVKQREALNIRTLGERFQLLLSDPLIARMNGRLLPDAERGKAILHVDIERARPYQLSLAANNYRPASIGAENATLSGWVRNLTGRGDYLEASHQAPLGDGSAQRTALGWRMPLNTWGTQLTLNYEEGASSVIEQPLQPLDVLSRLTVKDAGIGQTLVETLGNRLAVGLNRIVRENRTTLLGTPFSFVPGEPSGTAVARDWRFWQEYAHRWEDRVVALRSTFTFGENNLLESGTSTAAMPERRYRVWLGQAQYAQRLTEEGIQLILRLNVQESPHRLLALEGMSVGGVNTVRGYRENQLVRDTGTVANVELDFPLLADPAKRLSLNLAPFFDYGRTRNKGEDPSAISSVGLAARLRWQGLAVDLAAASKRQRAATSAAGSNLQDKGIHFQVSYSFF